MTFSLWQRRPRIERYVFVFTYGRSGSTLLMGLLNSLPGYCIRGENGNALYKLYEFDKRLQLSLSEAGNIKNSVRPTHPWFGLHQLNMPQLRADLRDTFTRNVLTPEKGARVSGFKEIRFSESEVPDLEGYLAFVREVFAPCKIIFNHRKMDNVAKSGWWGNMPKALEKLQFMEDRFNAIPASDSVYHFSYDALVADPTYARGLMEFLGERFDETAVRNLLSVRHSY